MPSQIQQMGRRAVIDVLMMAPKKSLNSLAAKRKTKENFLESFPGPPGCAQSCSLRIAMLQI